MNKLLTVLLLLSGGTAAQAVPVVPNFTQGSMTSHTETTSNVTETINSVDYRTGWEYTVTGSGISNNGERSTRRCAQAIEERMQKGKSVFWVY